MKRAARFQTGSVVFDKRRKTWNFLQWQGGKRRSRLIGTFQQFPTKGAAQRAAQGLRPLETQTINLKGADQSTVKALAARYQQERLPARRSTARVYLSWLNKHVLPEWGEKRIQEVQPLIVEKWLNGLLLAPKSKVHVRNMLHLLVDFAMLAGVLEIGRNPLELVTIKGATKRLRKPRNLTVEEFQRLHAELKQPFNIIAMLCVCFGLRISECLALRWSDIDWDLSTLQVERGIVEQNVDDVKTDDSRRTFTLAPELLSVLEKWCQVSPFPAADDWIFASPLKFGKLPYSYTGFWRELKRAAAVAKIGDLATHAFRHTYRTWLDSIGTPVGVQQPAHAPCRYQNDNEPIRQCALGGYAAGTRESNSTCVQVGLMDCKRIARTRNLLKDWLLR
jgi:integrase